MYVGSGNKTFDLQEQIGPISDNIAVGFGNQYQQWESMRNPWATRVKELRNYIFATDTSTTSNASLPWKNSTTVPKLTQIRDNLHANYMMALFPSDNWLTWEGDRNKDESEAKRKAIEGYMRTKFRQDRMELVVSRLLLDYIDYGNCFATVEWADDSLTIPASEANLDVPGAEQTVRGYVGPRLVRISPWDIVFDPTASTFEKTPKIVRSIESLGALVKRAENMPPGSDEQKMLFYALDRSAGIRGAVKALSQGDIFKSEGFQMDGFSSIQSYWTSDLVEVLTFYGDYYDSGSKEFIGNAVITVIDRHFLVSKRRNPNWTAADGIFHAGWRQRPDNLYAMGPLDNLVGMQYRIDHLENLKADVFDLIAYPIQLVIGYVEDYDYAPGTKIICGDEGKVEFLHPPHEALNADAQIIELERRMEELAGAPKEAMGQRTPGEKTKFEVQVLDNASQRIFLNKIIHFQKTFFEKVLNYSLALARQNMSGDDVTRTLDSEIDAVIFSTITRDDITANGVLRPRGAESYAEKANNLQNLMQILGSPVAQDPTVMAHWSGKSLAKAIEELSDLKKFNLYEENVRILEQQETMRLQNAAGEQTDVQAMTPAGLMPGDPESGVPL